jgi:hypothetical protein
MQDMPGAAAAPVYPVPGLRFHKKEQPVILIA